MLSSQIRPLTYTSNCSEKASWRGLTFKCLLPAHQSEPLLWLCGWAPLSSHRNQHLQLDSFMHLYWPHQQDDSRRSGPTICTPWAGASGRKELHWDKQQETEAARVWMRGRPSSGKGICNVSSREEKCLCLHEACPPLMQEGLASHEEPPVSIFSLLHSTSPAMPCSLLSLNSRLFLGT